MISSYTPIRSYCIRQKLQKIYFLMHLLFCSAKCQQKILRNFRPGGVGARAARVGGQSGHRCNFWSALNWPTSHSAEPAAHTQPAQTQLVQLCKLFLLNLVSYPVHMNSAGTHPTCEVCILSLNKLGLCTSMAFLLGHIFFLSTEATQPNLLNCW